MATCIAIVNISSFSLKKSPVLVTGEAFMLRS